LIKILEVWIRLEIVYYILPREVVGQVGERQMGGQK
jgi:hypothetical protein